MDPIIEDLRDLGFRTIWRAPDHYNHLHVDIANSGPIGAGSGGNMGGFTGPLEDVLLEVRLIDYDAPVAGVLRARRRRRRLLRRPARSRRRRARSAPWRATSAPRRRCSWRPTRRRSSSPACTACRSATCDSVGLFQQRDSWGTRAQRLDPVWASRQFLVKAIRQNEPYMSAGQLAQDVQISKFPERYDERRGQAMALIAQYCSGSSKSRGLMRRLVAACVTAALLAGAAGCGGDDEVAARADGAAGRLRPDQAGQRARPSGRTRRRRSRPPRPWRRRSRPGRSASSASRA